MWDKETIYNKVIKCADQYGYKNPQQRKQLVFALYTCEDQDVFDGLITFFLTKQENIMNRQELAGFLLYSLKPKDVFNLREVLKKSLSNYELSVEQFPLYFVDILGMKPMTKTLDSIENDSLTEYELKALRTMQFWIRNTKCNKVEKL